MSSAIEDEPFPTKLMNNCLELPTLTKLVLVQQKMDNRSQNNTKSEMWVARLLGSFGVEAVS